MLKKNQFPQVNEKNLLDDIKNCFFLVLPLYVDLFLDKNHWLHYLCPVHVIWTERRISKLVLNIEYFLFLSFLIVAEFYNLWRIQGIIRVP